ncbi:UNVERIFIED_CONTAM: hypothetical protein FKN15_023800 [Acipenser sinensis]
MAARRKDSEDKSSKSHKSEDQHDREHVTEKGRERLSSENGEDRHRRKEKKLSRDGIAAEVETGRNPGPEAGRSDQEVETENGVSSHARGPDPF